MRWISKGFGIGGLITFACAGVWLGCGDDTTGSPGSSPDSGTADGTTAITPDSGGGPDGSVTPDGSPDGGTMLDGGGGDAATTSCATYCADVVAACGTGSPYAQYQNVAECLLACSILKSASADEQATSAVGTVDCRDEHALNALAADASAPGGQGRGLGQNPHCWHAGPYGGSVCGDPCTSFCFLDTAFCSAADGFDAGPPPYASMAACLTKCPTYTAVDSMGAGWDNDGGFNAAGAAGNTLDCREYHLLNAMNPEAGASSTLQAQQTTHCPHTASMSAVCGDAGM